MIKIPLITDWNICTPTLFRFLEKEYVDAFFKEGSLRLSSFSKFHTHEDEQRLDKTEGKTMFVHRTFLNGGQTLTARATHGVNAYVLSASMRYDKELMKTFNRDSYIRIKDTTGFGMAIARQIPGLIKAFESPCLYQDMKIITADLGFIDINQFRDSQNPAQLNKELISDFIDSKMQHYPLFLKSKAYAHQVEYRIVWITRDKTPDYLDIKAPDAIQFCEKPNSLNE